MNLVVGFAPFILFALLSRLSADLALWIAFAAAFVVTIRDFVESPSLRLLDAGSLALFCLLALARGFLAPEMPLVVVRFITETALFLLLAGSLVIRRPFSIDYARLDPREANWEPALFLKVNYIVSAVWVGAFAAMAIADGIITFDPDIQIYGSIAVSVLALAGAVTFTLLYPARVAKQAALPPGA
ncbi:MAG: hypothetical protein H6924_11330 [Alphaproteobacteria bacterium]|nr:hypothetical protein [Alphaproteobacteria bacterium]